MEMTTHCSPELHVAQQSRREKLRVPQLLDDSNGDLPTNFHPQLPTMVLPLEVMNFASNSDSYDLPNGCDNFKPFTGQICGNLMLPQFSAHLPTPVEVSGSTSDYPTNELALLPASFVSQGSSDSRFYQHGLSLSLSSNQICEIRRMGDPQELKSMESGIGSLSSVAGQTMIENGDCGNPIQDNSGHVYRNLGPLGPFTGYTTILRDSKFLKPAQQILDEFLNAAGLRQPRGYEEAGSVCATPNQNHNIAGGGGSSSALASKSNDLSCGSTSCESYKPNCHEKKAKLLHMQEEVCKRHKQYHQQMEMMMSSFELVPGLSNATPYIFRSLRIISKHFRCIKNAIAAQLKHAKKTLREDLSSSTSLTKGGSFSLRFEQNFSKFKSGGIGYVGHQNHIWRPQRGLPERAVSILRAWLFDHFLHPYPTDTDKQMLATQTGLSRNQVSNWFINARVRLWKPMVEEIHMLETKGASRCEPNSNNSGTLPISNNWQAGGNQPANMMCDKQFECLGSTSSMEECRGEVSTEQLFQKHSLVETHQIPTSMTSSILSFLPYQRQGLEMGGIDAVSLTLGLRHGSEATQQLQDQFRQGLHYGSHVIHDFSG